MLGPLAMAEATLQLYGPEISTYARVCCAVAEEARVSWRLTPTGTGSDEAARHHPFLRTPAAYIDGHHFYESEAICRYLDDVYNAAALQAPAGEPSARMTQWISITNNYLFPITEERLVLPRVVAPLMGRQPNEQMIEEALPIIAYHLDVVTARLEASPYLAGPDVSLADFFMYCVIDAMRAAPEGAAMLAERAPLAGWKDALDARPSLQATAWPEPASLVKRQDN